MNQNQTLLIPITVRACLCGRAPSKKIYAGYQLGFTDLDDPDIPIDNGLFVPGNPPEPGIHLSFSLPEGFTRGTQEESGTNGNSSAKLCYPLVPNRWAVVRMWLEDGDSLLRQKLFLIESDALQKKRGAGYNNTGSSSWPYPQTPDHPYRYLGRSYALSQAEHVPQDTERLALTAVSPVNPFFSAYYPHCRNVFGFYDDLPADGIHKANISYLVCGWYQDAAGPEPLSLLKTAQQLDEVLLMKLEGTGLPETSLCHGLLCGIEWKGADFSYPTGIPDDPQPGEVEDKPDLALGNTSDEAAAALAGADSGISPRLFQCFLRNLCPDLLGEQGSAEVEKELYAAGFSTLQPPDLICLSSVPGTEHRQPPSERIMKQISDLRSRQRQLFSERMKQKQRCRTAFETWQLFYTAREDRDRLYAALQAYVTEIQREQTILADIDEQIRYDINNLAPGPGYELKTEPAPPFYQPADPVLLVRQLANTDGKVTGKLTVCRRSEQVNTSVTFTGLCASPVTVYPDDLFGNAEPSDGLPEALPLLIGEASLFSAGFAALIARKALQKAGFILPDPARTEELAEQLRQVQQQFVQLPSIFYDRELPEIRAITVFKPQWHPLYLEWQCFYYPDKALLKEQPDLKNWRLKDGRYDYCGDISIMDPQNRYSVSGRQLLSDNASRQLETGVNSFFEENVLPLKDPRSRSLLSQSLSGFNDMLLMRDQMKLLPLFSTDGLVKASLSLLQALPSDEMGTAAVFDRLFSPIRAGFLAFGRIRILDKLGRFQDILSPDLYCSEEMRFLNAPAKPHEAMLQPRLEQYTRLHAKWICAVSAKAVNDADNIDGAEASFVPTASPLCGFLLPNGLDNSLMAFTAGGTPVGSLVLTQTGSGIDFKSPPGEKISHHLPEDINPQLYRILYSLQTGPKENLIALLSYIDRLDSRITPAPHGPAEVEFIGRPLVLCRLSLKLEQAGDPESYRHLEGQIPDPSHTANVKNAVFSLQIGELNDYRDGMAGFYLNKDFDHLHIYPGSGTQTSYFYEDNLIPAALDAELPPDELCVLMDAYARLTVKPGILPACTLSLPDELVNASLDNIRTTYFTGPVLSNEKQLSIPAAYQNDRSYFFYQAGRTSRTEASGKGISENCWKTTKLEQTDSQAFSIPYPVKVLEGYIQIQKHKEGENDPTQQLF